MIDSLLFASSNKGKLEELRSYFRLHLPKLKCLGPEDLGKQAPEVEETGTTYRENAWLKARAYFDLFGVPVLADDSGLEVDALNGGPGVLSARYGGADVTWPQRWAHLWKDLRGKAEPWTARFRCVLCYFDGKTPRYFEGTVEGCIIASAGGRSGFGYDPIFFSNDLKKTFGEATAAEKDRVSHRARALNEFRRSLGG